MHQIRRLIITPHLQITKEKKSEQHIKDKRRPNKYSIFYLSKINTEDLIYRQFTKEPGLVIDSPILPGLFFLYLIIGLLLPVRFLIIFLLLAQKF